MPCIRPCFFFSSFYYRVFFCFDFFPESYTFLAAWWTGLELWGGELGWKLRWFHARRLKTITRWGEEPNQQAYLSDHKDTPWSIALPVWPTEPHPPYCVGSVWIGSRRLPNFRENVINIVEAKIVVFMDRDLPRKYTMVQSNQKSRGKYWATRLSIRSFARTAPSFALRMKELRFTRSLAYSLSSLWESEWYDGYFCGGFFFGP